MKHILNSNDSIELEKKRGISQLLCSPLFKVCYVSIDHERYLSIVNSTIVHSIDGIHAGPVIKPSVCFMFFSF